MAINSKFKIQNSKLFIALLLALWFLWLAALIVMSRAEWGKKRPTAPVEERSREGE